VLPSKLDIPDAVNCIANIAQDGQPPQAGNGLAQEFEPLAAKIGRELRQEGSSRVHYQPDHWQL
jgi:hypothetical protein